MKLRDLPQRHREHREERAGNKGRRGTPTPGVCVRVAGKGLTRQGVCKSGKHRTYRRVFLRFWRRKQRFEVGRGWKKRGWGQGRDKFRGAANHDAEPRLDGGRIGRRVRVGAGGRWPLAKAALGERVAPRKTRFALAITAYFTAGGGPAKLYEGTKMYPCTCARGRPEIREELS